MEINPIFKVIDPNNVPEILAVGPYNCSCAGGLTTLTFTHVQLDAAALFQSTPAMEQVAVVRARIVLPTESLRNLRDSLNQLIAGADAQNSPGYSESAN